MRALLILGLGVFLLAAPSLSHADGKIVEKVTKRSRKTPASPRASWDARRSSSFRPPPFGAPLPSSGEPPSTATLRNW